MSCGKCVVSGTCATKQENGSQILAGRRLQPAICFRRRNGEFDEWLKVQSLAVTVLGRVFSGASLTEVLQETWRSIHC